MLLLLVNLFSVSDSSEFVDNLDKIRKADEQHYELSRSRLGESFNLIEEINRAYRFLGEKIVQSKVGPTDDIALVPSFLLSARYQFNFGTLACLRGHLTDGYVYLRRAIDAVGYAGRISRDPQLAHDWLTARPSSGSAARTRQRFRSTELFPEGNEIWKELRKQWRFCSEHAHPSVAALSRGLKSRVTPNEFITEYHLYEISEDEPAEPASTFLYIARTHMFILRAFSQIVKVVLESDPFGWKFTIDGVEARIAIEADKWKPAIQARTARLRRRRIHTESGLIVYP